MNFLFINFFSFFKFIYNYVKGSNYPFITVLRLNDSCNLTCHYCDTYKFSNHIDFNKLEKFLNNVYQRGCRNFILTGGEPFLYKYKDELIHWFKTHRSYLIINTNGTLISNDKYKEFLLIAKEVLVSIDGLKKYTDLHRGSGVHDKAIETLEFLNTKKIKTSLSCVLTNDSLNDENLNYILYLKRKFNVLAGIHPITEDGRINNTNYSLANKVELVKLLNFKKFIMTNRKSFPEISNELINYLIQPSAFKCKTYQYAIYLDVDNYIYPCINVIDRVDARVGHIDDININGKFAINCQKCSCSPLISTNLLLQEKKVNLKLLKSVMSRFLRNV